MNKDRVKKGLVNAAPYIAGASVQVPFLFDGDNWFNIAMLLTNTGVAYMNYKSGVLKFDREAFIKSPLCQEFLGLYDEFTSDVAKMFGDLGVEAGIDLAVAYKLCLENGIFSCDDTDRYALFENDSDKFIALLGGRVTTGAHCCRHSASLFSDISGKVPKGLSPKVSVFLDKDYNGKRKIVPNHLVSGLVHKNKKLLFDSTSSFNSLFADGLAFIQDDKVRGRHTAENVTGIRMTFAPDAYDNKKFFSTDLYDQFMELESVKNSSEVFDDYMESMFKNVEKLGEFRDFHEEEKPKILQLSNLSKIVSPHGKEIVKEK